MANKAYYENLLNNANIKAFLMTIRKGEGTLAPKGGYNTLVGGGTFSNYIDHPNIYVKRFDSTAAGAYQIIIKTWRNAKSNLSLTSFQPHDQDVAAVYLIQGRGAIQDVLNGNISSAFRKCKDEWVSLPGGNATLPDGSPQRTQNLANALNFFEQNGGTLSEADKKIANGEKSYSQTEEDRKGNNTNNNINKDEQELNNELKINLEAVENNVDVLEADNVDVSWGSRSNSQEQSDWIGLRQYLLYLSTTYIPQSIVPFVELIPKFFLDEPTSANGQQGGFNFELSGQQKEKFLKTKKRLDDLNKNGGIDMLTLDPFQDINKFNDDGSSLKSTDSPSTPLGRNFGYRIFGTVVLNPGIMGEETSKAGAIGFKSMEISSGAAIQQGVTLVTMQLLDVQGNKFLDITSPWSFLLNATQINGDFFFRYGWQLTIPKYNNKETDRGSLGYKFWNHPGWRIFGNGKDDSIEKLKNDISSMAERSGANVITLTQSPNIKSLEYPGYTEHQNALINDKSVGVFSVNRSQLNIEHYYIISMINPTLGVDAQDGSITATIQFRMNTAVSTCLCPLSKSDNVHKLVNESSNNETTLYDLMKNLIVDNKNFLNNDEKLKTYASDLVNPDTEDPKNWIIVKKLSNMNQEVNPKDIKIKFDSASLDDINTNKGSNNTNLTLIAWLSGVCENNKLTLVGAGDPSTAGVHQVGGFVFIWDDAGIEDSKNAGGAVNQDAATGFLGNSTKERVVMQDDVFSFRFKGSLVEEIKIENNENMTAQNLENQQKVAEANAQENQVETGGADANRSSTTGTAPTASNNVTWKDKKQYMQYILSKMSAATIKAIAHPWLKLGYPIYVKGNGYFDGKYIISQLTHRLDDANKFTSEIQCVKVQNDSDYAKKQDEITQNTKFSMQNPYANYATDVSKKSNATRYDTPSKKANFVTSLKKQVSNTISPQIQNMLDTAID